MALPPFFDIDLIDYLTCITPLVIGHIIVPPLEIFYGARAPEGAIEMYSFFLGDFFDQRKIESWLLASYDERTPEQWVLHMFVHGSYDHLVSNLIALINFGYPVCQEFGGLGLYVVFLLGGIAAAIPSELHKEQKRTFEKEIENYIFVEGGKYVPDFLREKFRVLSKQLGVKSSILVPEKACGSSGATCALSGCLLVLTCRDVLRSIYHIFTPHYSLTSDPKTESKISSKSYMSDHIHYKQTSKPKSYTWFSYLRGIAYNIRDSIRHSTYATKRELILKMIRIYHMSHYLVSEVSYIFSSSDNFLMLPSSYNYTNSSMVNNPSFRMPEKKDFWKIIENSRIGHAAHVQGFLFGAAFALIFGVGIPSLQRRKKYRY